MLAGDSAGGNLALMLALRLRERGAVAPAACALISPWSDLTMPARSFLDNDCFDWGTRDVLVRHARAFAGKVPLDSPLLSPVRARLHGLPPTLVLAGEVEIPLDDILELARALVAAGVSVTRCVVPDMPHDAPMFAAYHPAAAASVGTIASFVRKHAEAK